MRLVTIRQRGSDGFDPRYDRVAVVLGNGRLVPLLSLAVLAPDKLAAEIDGLSLVTVLGLDPSLGVIREVLAEADPVALSEASIDPAEVYVAPTIPQPGKIVGVGYNYLDHIREQGLERPARPVLFSIFANAVTGDGDPVRRPAGTHALDFEAELAVVIGRRASRVDATSALPYVAGYTAANDITARDWQGQAKALRAGEKGDGQWLRAKGSDTFLPLGPDLVPACDLGDGSGLRIRSWLTQATGPRAGDAVLMQDGNTSEVLFGVAELISIISAEVTLEPGDVIVTGTPSGVGVFRDPPIFMEPGDLVSVEIEGIGRLTNPVTDADGRAPEESPAALFMAERSVLAGVATR